ncbi:unnamed protein product [Protopolystoma xenopodis]|uniref:Uncharacterized protein n=1 Tax=Protopolystoma xenopodis TaxID=117903 RepID=A0A3S5A9Q4_9PLAT|nr:unnamed protein product [Protopolystoma xenopodis]
MRVGIFGGRLRGAYKTCDNVVWLMLKEDLSISYMPQGSNSSTKMPIPVNFPTAVAVENKVFVLGGQNSDNQTVKVVQVFHVIILN